MEENMSLQEFKKNTFTVLGSLKEKNLDIKPDRQGNQVIRGNIVVEVVNTIGNEEYVDNIRVNVYARATTNSGNANKVYDSALAVLNKFNIGDRISVGGHVSYDSYTGRNGNLVELNRFNGFIFHHGGNKIDKDSSKGILDVIVMKYSPLRNSDDLGVSAFTVGYKGRIQKVVYLEAPKEMKETISEGKKARVYFRIENHPVTTVTESSESEEGLTHAFGPKQTVTSSHFVSRLYVENADNFDFPPKHEDVLAAIKELREQTTLSQNKIADSLPSNMGAKPEETKKQDPFANTEKISSVDDDDLPF